MLGIGVAKLVVPVGVRDEELVGHRGRIQRRLQARGAGGADRSRWEADASIRVVRRLHIQVAIQHPPRAPSLQRVLNGRIGLKRHADAQAIVIHRRDDGALLSLAHFLFDDRRQRHHLVSRHLAFGGARVPLVEPDLFESAHHDRDRLARTHLMREVVGLRKEVALEIAHVARHAEPIHHGRVTHRREHAVLRDLKTVGQRRDEIPEIPPFGDHEPMHELLAGLEGAEDIVPRGALGEPIRPVADRPVPFLPRRVESKEARCPDDAMDRE